MKLADINITERFRVRDRLDEATVQQYEQLLDYLPPVLVYQIDDAHYLVDGFHRCEAAKRQGRSGMAADVRTGTEAEAYEAAIAANISHGLPLRSKERRRAAKELLKLFPERSNRWLAEDVGMNHGTVIALRSELESIGEIRHCSTTISKDGRRWPCDCAKCQPERTPPRQQTAIDSGGSTDEIGAQVPPEHIHPTTTAEQPSVDSQSTSEDAEATKTETAVGPAGSCDAAPTTPDCVVIQQGDARNLDMLTGSSVHLAVTSPPYNVAIGYGVHDDALPMDQWQALLTEAWRECHRVSVPGGRLAVVVPDGVGRNPWQPISPLVQETLVDAGWVLQGQIIWDKATTGNRTTWGSYRLPTAPRLRDRHEVVIIAAKEGRLELSDQDRKRDTEGSYSPFLEDGDVFMRLTQSVWQIPPASAQAIGHPAPFPESLVTNLIHLYGFPGCMVLDPFAGSGTTGLAAKKLGCQAALIDIDHDYCHLMRRRIEHG